MTINPYQDLVLWGHNLQDFREMFALTETELNGKILDCCGGPDSFNAELTKQGGHVISCDAMYGLPLVEIKSLVTTVSNEMLMKVEEHRDRFIWDKVQSPKELFQNRQQNIDLFLADYEQGLQVKRYQHCDMPELPFADQQFDLALSSHYFFANCPEQSLEFHLIAIQELCRVAKEVRIFPLVDSRGEIPALVGPIMQAMYQAELGIEFKAVPYQFQTKGNAMLRVWSTACEII